MADGSRAVEVQTIFRGVVTNARVLSNPEGKTTHGLGTGMLFAGIAIAAVSLVTFVATAMDVGSEKLAYEEWQASGKESKNFAWKSRSVGLDVVVFGGFLAATCLAYMGLKRRGKTNQNFIIGSEAGADAPVDPEFVPSPAHPLVAGTGMDYVVNITPRMGGEVHVDGQSYPLANFVQQRGSSFSLPPSGYARLDCGETTFLVTATNRPRVLEVPFLIWKWNEQVYTVGSAVALLLFLLMIFSVPPDPKSLSLDLFNSDNRFVKFLIKPPEEKEEENPGVAEVQEERGARRQGQAPQGRRRKDGEEDLQEQGGSVRPQGSEGQSGSAPGQEAGGRAGEERRYPRRLEADRRFAHRLDLRARFGARQRRLGCSRRA